ncbi:MAG: ATP-binding protein, partial [Dehalococcoidales bacterium]|nr:ATP-binding protein [Dehalococcoidales bacterium]
RWQFTPLDGTLPKQTITLNVLNPIPSLYLDIQKIHQVISNVLDNALRFTKRNGTVTILVKTNDNKLVIEIVDHGKGMSKDFRQELFEPNFQTHNIENLSGLGIGLALCKMFVELHKGNIWILSAEGQGTTVGFSLPLLTSPADI